MSIYRPMLQTEMQPYQFCRGVMRLNLSTDYALRVMLFVGARSEGLSQIAEIAAAYDISHNHLMKVVNRLVQLGYLESVRGRHGGMKLARKPEKIFAGEIVRDFEPDLRPLDCDSCIMAKGCQLTCLLQKAVAAFLAQLDAASIADILEREKQSGGPHVGHRAPLFER
jgi:Rrf2 family transcriptional regulator, nitric oxide-sensitive transcriptional repressor